MLEEEAGSLTPEDGTGPALFRDPAESKGMAQGRAAWAREEAVLLSDGGESVLAVYWRNLSTCQCFLGLRRHREQCALRDPHSHFLLHPLTKSSLSSASEEMGTLKLQEWGFVSKRLSEPEVGFWGPLGSSGGQTQTLVATSLAKDPGSGRDLSGVST